MPDRRQRRGKSTLMAVLCGTHDHYEGEMTSTTSRSPFVRRGMLNSWDPPGAAGVDVALVPGLSIAENIMLDSWRSRGMPSAGRGFGSWRARRWRNWTCRWMCAAPSTAARWPKNSKSCWRARCRTIAAF
jgi:simple sugar transport system ATP-binding protein